MTRPNQHRIENFLWSIMGPAELGANQEREGYVADATADLCNKCALPWTAHQRLHRETNTYLVCPAAG